MRLNELPKLVTRNAKRLGRGYGSGKGGHTSGRGQKGQKAREKVRIFFEGTKMKKSLIKRLPFQRGKNKMKPLSADALPVDIALLNKFTGKEVTVAALIKQGLVSKQAESVGVKILGSETLKAALTVKVPASSVAAAKITAAGGKIEL